MRTWNDTQFMINQHMPDYILETASVLGVEVPFYAAETVAHHQVVPQGQTWENALLLWRIYRMWQQILYSRHETAETVFMNCCEILHIDEPTVESFMCAEDEKKRYAISPVLFLVQENIQLSMQEKGVLLPDRFSGKNFEHILYAGSREELEYFFLRIPPGGLTQYRVSSFGTSPSLG